MSAALRLVRTGARALWGFLVGETPEFAAVVAALVGYAVLLRHVHLAVVYGLPALVVVVMAVSVHVRRLPPARRPEAAPEVVGDGVPAAIREVPASPS